MVSCFIKQNLFLSTHPVFNVVMDVHKSKSVGKSKTAWTESWFKATKISVIAFCLTETYKPNDIYE